MTYSSSLSLARQQTYRRNQNTVSIGEKVQAIGPISNTIIILVLVCLLGLVYLTQVSKTNAFGYKIHDLETKHTSLKADHEDLLLAEQRLKSFAAIKSSNASQSLVSVAPTATIQQ